MKKVIILFTLIISFCFILPESESSVTWELSKDKKGVKSYTASFNNSEFKQYKAETIIDASAEVIGELLLDIPAYPNWFDSIVHNEVLKNEKNFNYTIYLIFHATFPLADRDAFGKVKGKINLSKGTGHIDINMINKFAGYMLNPDNIPLANFHAEFDITVIDRNRTKVNLLVWFEPGGTVGPKIVHAIYKNISYKSLINMKDIVKEKKYIALGKKSKFKSSVESYCRKIKK